MPEIIVDMPSRSCYRLFPRPGIQEFQRLGPGLFSLMHNATKGGFGYNLKEILLQIHCR